MSIPSLFQTVQMAINNLTPILQVIQNASQPGLPLHSDQTLRECSNIFRTLVTDFRKNVTRFAHETAEYSLNNVLSALVSENLTNTQKQAVIDRFLYSGDQQGGTSLLQIKMQAAIVTRQRFERFQADITRSQLILQAQMINVDGINTQLNVILQGFDSIKSFYEQVHTIFQGYKERLEHTDALPDDIQQQARWLAAVSADMKAFLDND